MLDFTLFDLGSYSENKAHADETDFCRQYSLAETNAKMGDHSKPEVFSQRTTACSNGKVV